MLVTTAARLYQGLTITTIVAACAFAGAIVLGAGAGYGLHELGGVVLLALLVVTIAIAYRLRPQDPRRLNRALLGLLLLISMGASGAGLGTHALPSSLYFLPLLLLAALIGALLEMLRVSGLPGLKRSEPGGRLAEAPREA